MRGVDAVVIGGGFYGCHAALALRGLGMERVILVEREDGLLRRASYANQARVHNGYHYPRSLPTALSSRRNFRRFVGEHRFAVLSSVEMIYAIARQSRVSADQFARFCDEIGAVCREDARSARELFEPDAVEACFAVEEFAFDATALESDLRGRLGRAGVDVRLGESARLTPLGDAAVEVALPRERIESRHVVNCTYADLDGVGVTLATRIKKELAEIALIDPPRELEGRAVTVMDGPFFSSVPFKALDCYSLTHVRYTPHRSWTGEGPAAPDDGASRGVAMMRDAARFMPCMARARLRGSLYEVKAILERNESDDGRPILYEKSRECPRVLSILGSKIDNIYDVIEALQAEDWG